MPDQVNAFHTSSVGLSVGPNNEQSEAPMPGAMSGVQRTVSTLAIDYTTGLNTVQTQSVYSVFSRNSVLGQVYNATPQRILADISTNSSVDRPMSLPHALPLNNVRKIGLLRAPGIDESKITQFDYNLSMAQEALVNGVELRNEFKSGSWPTWSSLWDKCRQWRCGRLDRATSDVEKEKFSTVRPDGLRITPILSLDDRYLHLTDFLMTNMFNASAVSNQGFTQEDCVFRVFAQEEVHDVPDCKRLAFKTFTFLDDNQQVPLTELRMTLAPNGHQMKDTWISPLPEIGPYSAAIIHMDGEHLPKMVRDIETRMVQFGEFLRAHNQGAFLEQALAIPNPQTPSVVHILERLGDIHYLLAHAMCDWRGSAAKSELFVRSLAASAGLELPAYKSGFVPDLDTFMMTRQAFVKNYINAFEY